MLSHYGLKSILGWSPRPAKRKATSGLPRERGHAPIGRRSPAGRSAFRRLLRNGEFRRCCVLAEIATTFKSAALKSARQLGKVDVLSGPVQLRPPYRPADRLWAELDRGCNPDDPAYVRAEQMRKLIDTGFGFVPPGDLRTMKPNTVPGTGPCSRGDASFGEKFLQASVASGEGDYVYTRTMVWFVFEGIESAEAALGTSYYDLLVKSGSPFVNKTVVPGVDHAGLIRTREGTDKIRDILLSECRIR